MKPSFSLVLSLFLASACGEEISNSHAQKIVAPQSEGSPGLKAAGTRKLYDMRISESLISKIMLANAREGLTLGGSHDPDAMRAFLRKNLSATMNQVVNYRNNKASETLEINLSLTSKSSGITFISMTWDDATGKLRSFHLGQTVIGHATETELDHLCDSDEYRCTLSFGERGFDILPVSP